MSRPKTDFEALRQDLHQVYEGHPWHGSSITSVLDGISAESAKSRPIPDAHNIWELVLHMAVWTREVASRVRGADARNPTRRLAGAAGSVAERKHGNRRKRISPRPRRSWNRPSMLFSPTSSCAGSATSAIPRLARERVSEPSFADYSSTTPTIRVRSRCSSARP